MGFTDYFPIKYTALAALVLQNTFLVVFMRLSRVQPGPSYATSTAVVCMEVMKLLTCSGVMFWQSNCNIGEWMKLMKSETVEKPMEVVKIAVPSLLYTVQNNLLYYALSHLDTPTYMVGYQTKILTTAIFSVLLLGRRLTRQQWGSLVLLTVGVSMAQLSSKGDASKGENSMAGFVAVIGAACTSGFAGVYFEKILKGTEPIRSPCLSSLSCPCCLPPNPSYHRLLNATFLHIPLGATTSIWARNVQICCTSIGLGLLGVYMNDGTQVSTQGFFYGYNWIVWTVVMLQAVGGLVVAVVVKYADNILKGFAASFSIITRSVHFSPLLPANRSLCLLRPGPYESL